MSNLDNTIRLIEQALRYLPQDSALGDVRKYLSASLSSIQSIKKKRERREANHKKEMEKKSFYVLRKEEIERRMKILDNMLKQEGNNESQDNNSL